MLQRGDVGTASATAAVARSGSQQIVASPAPSSGSATKPKVPSFRCSGASAERRHGLPVLRIAPEAFPGKASELEIGEGLVHSRVVPVGKHRDRLRCRNAMRGWDRDRNRGQCDIYHLTPLAMLVPGRFRRRVGREISVLVGRSTRADPPSAWAKFQTLSSSRTRSMSRPR
jgi:hypothetical protein